MTSGAGPAVSLQALSALPEADRSLVQAALAVLPNAYAPYSNFCVGAAVRTRAGRVYAGCNMENASYGLTVCAEVSALQQAVAAGDFEVQTIAIAGRPRTAAQGGEPVAPCGRCRQLILEAAHVAACDVRILSSNGDGSRVRCDRISTLLPHAFGPGALPTP